MPRLRNINALKESAERINTSFDTMEQIVFGRQDVLRQIKLALITKHHVFMKGVPGVAKSMLADLLLETIVGRGEYFTIKCTKKMSEDYIVGPPDMRLFRKEGRLVHMTDETLVTAEFAFLDEFLDLTPSALRGCLELLNERTFTRGRQRCKSPLWTAIAATNFDGGDEEALEAVLDRFIFKCKVEPLSSDADKKAMLINRFEGAPSIEPLRMEDIRRLHNAMKKVIVPELVIETYIEIVGKMQHSHKVSDRTLSVASDIVRANAVLSGRRVASVKDLSALDTAFCSPGFGMEQSWANAFKCFKGAIEREERYVITVLAQHRVNALYSMTEDCGCYDDIYPIAIEAREALSLIRAYKATYCSDIVESATEVIEAIFDKADKLYSDK